MKKDFFDILKRTSGISEEDYREAYQIQEEKGGRIGGILVQKKRITETQLLEALSVQYDIPFWPDLPLDNIGNDFTQTVPIQFLKKYAMVPLECNGGSDELERMVSTSERVASASAIPTAPPFSVKVVA